MDFSLGTAGALTNERAAVAGQGSRKPGALCLATPIKPTPRGDSAKEKEKKKEKKKIPPKALPL